MADSTDIESDGSNIEVELNNDLDTNTSDLNEPGYKCEQRNDGEWFRVFFNPLAKVMTTLKDSMQNGRLHWQRYMFPMIYCSRARRLHHCRA
ncbi:hypothetical protein DPMN_028386 [Dreissena polymorpha]|uniref:Uncharacterized protein n=1 Tax=Dreissena polymorpha TaxID=45954 RepID=A0A9D4LX72_DREPO|nr:hypothetical protein DPMN_028386 [Dreissena polymorpha]